MVSKCDVVLENYRVGALARLGLGYEAARERNPGIIYCSVSGFGQDGPYRDRAALDLILQAESGMISVTGEPGGHGVRCGVSIADMTAGMYAAYGIMLALRVKERTGRGQAIDVSMLEGQLSLLGSMIGAYLADGEVPAPMGTAYKALLPYQTFRTKTRDLALAVGQREALEGVLSRPSAGPSWPTTRAIAPMPTGRGTATRSSRRSRRSFLTRTLRGMGAAPARARASRWAPSTASPRWSSTRRCSARGTLVEMDHPRAGKVRMVGAPVGSPRRRARCARPRRCSASTPTRCCASSSASDRRADRHPPGRGRHRPEAVSRAMKKEIVRATLAHANPNLSAATRFGNLVFVAGQTGRHPVTGEVGRDIREQTRNTLERIKVVLAAAGTSLDHVLSAMTHLTRREDLAAYNEEYAKYFPTDKPARTTVTVAALNAPELLVEITVIAGIPD